MARAYGLDPEHLAEHRCTPRDSVDRLVADWRTVRPDLDFSPVEVIARLGRVRSHLDHELERLFADHGIGGPTFAVLVTLARLQAPDGVSQRRLMEELGLTSGTVSVRIDRLVADELVERRPDPEDGRNSRITLTERGRELFERIVPAHLSNERRLLAALSRPERDLLADLLRKLLAEFEGTRPPPDAQRRLGLSLASAHVTIAMRQAVGLPEVAGLLVREVDGGGPAWNAGLRVGDVLTGARGRPLSSIAGLYAALDAASTSRRLAIEFTRGVDARVSRLDLTGAEPDRRPEPAVTAGRRPGDEHRI